jgi:DNA-binding GntR family transcriptional regulator
MSPGATFERVYNELKRMLTEGELAPGTPIEPALIGKRIASSITPIRDALHRLTGERLVEAPNHNGFRVPLPTEATLRELYDWNDQVLKLAAKKHLPGFGWQAIIHNASGTDIVASTAALFLGVARGTGNGELALAVGLLNARLAAFRHAEIKILESMGDELRGMVKVVVSGDRAALAKALTRYHRRRLAAVANILTQSTGQATRTPT